MRGPPVKLPSSDLKWLREQQLLTGVAGKQPTLLKLVHAGKLKGGLSLSLRATPDEVIGAVTHAMGGSAAKLRVVDVRPGPPLMLEVMFPQGSEGERVSEKWELADLRALLHNLNDLYKDDASVRRAVVLGEWEDALQVWVLDRAVQRALQQRRLLDA